MDAMDPGLFEGEQLRISTKQKIIYICACNYTVYFTRATER